MAQGSWVGRQVVALTGMTKENNPSIVDVNSEFDSLAHNNQT